MKKRFLPIFTALAMTLLVISHPTTADASQNPFQDAGFLQVKQEVAALDFTLEDLEGNQVRMSDYRGKTVLLYFWATW